ncbi:MAG: hypothetical protein E7287_08715 [Lachnospiraceae bacterium]|nr:hypothetical protein [Lachnospiraceae bacterium]
MIKGGLIIVYLLILSVFDGKEKAVPIILLVPGVLGAIGFMIYQGVQGEAIDCALGLTPGVVLLLVAVVTKKAGMADGIILGIIGVLEGYQAGMLIWGISMCAMLIAVVVLLCFKRVGRDTEVPYIPFLCGGYLIWKVMLG